MKNLTPSLREVGNRGNNTEQGRKNSVKQQKCYVRGNPGHLAKECRTKSVENRGQGGSRALHSRNRIHNGRPSNWKTLATTQVVESVPGQAEKKVPEKTCSGMPFGLADLFHSSDKVDTITLLVVLKM